MFVSLVRALACKQVSEIGHSKHALGFKAWELIVSCRRGRSGLTIAQLLFQDPCTPKPSTGWLLPTLV